MTPAPQMLSPKEVAARIGIHPRTFGKWRRIGKGPPFARLAYNVVRYDPVDVERWIRANQEVPAWQA